MPATAPSQRRYSAADLELIQQRADEARRHPFWPFARLTQRQLIGRRRQEVAGRRGELARWPGALL